jgi:OOP family OmpA-OmpF porin
MSQKGFVAMVGALVLALAGCANPPIKVNRGVCMVVGALAGAGAGVAIRNNRDTPADDNDKAAAAAIGAVPGAALGALLCGAPEPAPAPAARPAPPPPPPPPAPAPAPARIVLRGVNFDFDKSDIRPDAQVILDSAAEILNENPSARVEVAGHTDSVGTEEYNQGLSERRARAVVDYLAGKGVSADRLSPSGYGESRPVADNGTADGRAQNRRVELNTQ